MVLLRVLSGISGGGATVARRFPFRVGRGAQAQWRLEAPGLWEDHFTIDSSAGEGFVLSANPATWTLVNGERAGRVVLKNGDRIECGGLTVQFWLSPAQQRGLRLRETLTWIALAGFTAGQGLLCWWLIQ